MPILTDGQHRLCALRAAGIEHCPVKGNYLHDTIYATPTPAAEHARETITASWRTYAAERGWPPWAGTIVAALPRVLRARMINQLHTLDELIERLRSLKVWSGNPSYESITDRINKTWVAAGRPAGELT